jgi:predicted PurR-regulated permease PerM
MAPDRTASIARNAQVIVAVILGGVALRWLGDILTPLLLAVFLVVMVDGLSRLLRRRLPSLPSTWAMVAAIVISTLIFGLCVVIIADQANAFVQTLIKSEPKLNHLIRQGAHVLRIKSPGTVNQMLARADPAAYLTLIGGGLEAFMTGAFLVLVYLGFLIASRHTFERKMVRMFHDREERHEAMRLFLRVRDSIEAYLWIQTLLGAVIAVASWLVMFLVGLDDALFWAFLIFVVNYIPIVGAVAAIALPALFAVVQFGGWVQASIVFGGLWLITFVVGNILLPRMQGDSLNMDPLVVLLSLAFWGALWGLTGMFLSTPLTVLVMLILAQFDGSRWIAVLLSANGEPESMLRAAHRAPQPAAAAVPAE